MASRTCVSRSARISPANRTLLVCRCRAPIPRRSTRVHGDLGTQWAPGRPRTRTQPARRRRGPESRPQRRMGPAKAWPSTPAGREDQPGAMKRFSPRTIDGATSRTLLVVDDPDAAVARAVSLGATELAPVAGEHGWRVGLVPQRRLLQRGRQGRALRRLGGAGAVLHRDARCIQLAALTSPGFAPSASFSRVHTFMFTTTPMISRIFSASK